MSVSLWNDEQEKPVQHLRIVDLSVMLPAPYLTRLLAQYGADVVKVEAVPHGDPMREVKDTSCFELMNQGKRSVAVNLKTPEGVGLVKQLAGEADVFVENYREGIMDQLGLGYSDISEENPDLLYLSLRGLSQKSKEPAHDINFIAQSGIGEWFLESGVPNYSTQFGDMVAGTMVPLMKLLFHLANPARRGMHLISYMDESMRAIYLPRAYDTFQAAEKNASVKSGLHQMLNGSEPHSRYYRCRDGQWISLNAVQTKHWEHFCDVVDKAAWKPRQRDAALMNEVETLFLDAPSTYWEALANDKAICLFRVIPWAEHLSFSQARAQLGGDPLSWCGFQPHPTINAAPAFGSDTFALISGLGYDNKKLAEWMQKGVLFQPQDKAAASSRRPG